MARRAQAHISSRHTPRNQREQLAARYNKQRERRHYIELGMRWLRYGALALGVCVLGGGIYWSAQPGRLESWIEQTEQGFWNLTAHSGFAVREMFIMGRETVPLAAVKQAIGLKQGDPILSESVETLKERLEAIPSVKSAQVKRELPGTLYFHITERKPIAIWQHQQTLHLIDDQGVVMSKTNIKNLPPLLLVVGEDAPNHTAELLKFLSAEPELFTQVKAAVRVGGRRWNVRLNNGVEVKLPEEGAGQAWARLAALEKKDKVLERNIVGVDLRLNDRIYFRLPASAPTKNTLPSSSSET